MTSQCICKRWVLGRWSFVALLLGQLGCASSPGGAEPQGGTEPAAANPRAAGPARCVTLEVQNQSRVGVTVFLVWASSARRRLSRLSINERKVIRLPYRNEQLSLQFEAEAGVGGGAPRNLTSNGVSPTPGDRIEIVYRAQGPGPLRRVGTAPCG